MGVSRHRAVRESGANQGGQHGRKVGYTALSAARSGICSQAKRHLPARCPAISRGTLVDERHGLAGSGTCSEVKRHFPTRSSSALAQRPGGEPAWEMLKPFPGRIRRLLRWMLRKQSLQHPTSAMELQREIVELQREIEQCLADVERREALTARIALPLDIGRQWLNGAPWPRRAAIFGASAMGLVLALGYYWNSDLLSWSAPAMETSDVVRAEDSRRFGPMACHGNAATGPISAGGMNLSGPWPWLPACPLPNQWRQIRA